jgi:hypothetical protein
MVAASEDLFLHLFTPATPEFKHPLYPYNQTNTLASFPGGNLSFLNAISAVGTKFAPASDFYGPQSQQNLFVSSKPMIPLKGKILLKIET